MIVKPIIEFKDYSFKYNSELYFLLESKYTLQILTKGNINLGTTAQKTIRDTTNNKENN